MKWFQIAAVSCFVLFCSLMLLVLVTALRRPFSGSMGIDAAKIQQMRIQADRQVVQQER